MVYSADSDRLTISNPTPPPALVPVSVTFVWLLGLHNLICMESGQEKCLYLLCIQYYKFY